MWIYSYTTLIEIKKEFCKGFVFSFWPDIYSCFVFVIIMSGRMHVDHILFTLAFRVGTKNNNY